MSSAKKSKTTGAVPTVSKFAPLLRLHQSLTVGNLWLSVLSLAGRGKIYAYTLPEEIQRAFGFQPSRLLVYLVLYRLEGEGLLTSAEDGRRRYYSLTAKGKACLASGRSQLVKRAKEL